MMRTEEHRPVRLSEYRPPDWLVETVDLDVKLHPTQTPVRATLKVKPNPAAGAPAPLTLDGDGLTLVSLKIDGAPLAQDAYVASPDGLTIAQPPHRPFTLEIETLIAPQANTQLSALYRPTAAYAQCGRPIPSERQLLHPVRGRRLPPHHLLSGPARRDGGLHHAHRGGQSPCAGAAAQPQPAR